MANITGMFDKLKDMQARMAEMQERLQEIEISGRSGAGLITVVLNGKGEMKSVSIDPSLFREEEAGVVEDLIVAAYNDAKVKVEERVREEMAQVTDGLPLPPDMNLPV